MQRLDRILSEAGVASRKELRAIIRTGRVTADGAVVTDESRKFDEAAVHIAVDGQPVRLRGPVLIMLHKPAGYLTAADDPKAKTVMELVPDEYRRLGVMPVGRLDKDTEGLLLVTDDGALSHALMSPSRHVSKVYEAELDGVLAPDAAERFGAGLTLRDGTVCRPALLELLPDGRVRVTLHEGKYHQVKRMIAACGATVTFLKRVQLGGVRLDESLAPGEFRELTEEELGALRPPDGL